MARTALTVDTVTTAGVVLATDTGIADGHSFANSDGDVILYVSNGDATARDITIQTPGTVAGKGTSSEPIAERTVEVGAGAIKFIGPFAPSIFNQADGSVYVDYESGEEDHFEVVPLKVPR